MFLGSLIEATLNLFKLDITLGGFTFSYWQVFLFSWVAGIIVWFIWRFLDG